jgi:glutathione S-transferase
MRARMTLIYASVSFELREVNLKDKPAHLLEISPKGTVPVLLLENGTVIDESLDIMVWALNQNDQENWANAQDKNHNLIVKNDTEFTKLNHRYKYADRFPEKTMEDYRHGVELYLNTLEEAFDENNFLTSNQISMIDVALFPFIRQCAKVDETWFYGLTLPKLQAWLDHFRAHDIFKTAMIKQS